MHAILVLEIVSAVRRMHGIDLAMPSGLGILLYERVTKSVADRLGR